MNRVVATLPDSVEELCLVRVGLMVLKPTSALFAFRMGRAIATALKHPDAHSQGLLASERWTAGWGHMVIFQYWASYDQLEAWSHRAPHSEWWQKANERMRTKADFAVYHESYIVPRTGVESIYLNCPIIGLASFGKTGSAEGEMTTARDRLGRRSPRAGESNSR